MRSVTSVSVNRTDVVTRGSGNQLIFRAFHAPHAPRAPHAPHAEKEGERSLPLQGGRLVVVPGHEQFGVVDPQDEIRCRRAGSLDQDQERLVENQVDRF